MTDPRPETGWPIQKRTACRVGAHAFVWTGTWHADPERPPDPTILCDCGAVTWKETAHD